MTGNVIYSKFNRLQNNSAYRNSIGFDIDVLSSENTLIFNRAFLNSYQGIEVQDSTLNSITSNIIENNTAYNLSLDVANGNSIFSNILENSQTGVLQDGSSLNTVRSNIIRNNGIGVDIPGLPASNRIPSNNNSIYDNLIRNRVNGQDPIV